MSVKWETVQAGDRLYDVHSTRAGNTTGRTVGVWDVRVHEIDHAKGIAVVSWNGNPPDRWHRSRVEKLRRKRPELVRTMLGYRLKRRGEAPQ